jgi:hypothetical protein
VGNDFLVYVVIVLNFSLVKSFSNYSRVIQKIAFYTSANCVYYLFCHGFSEKYKKRYF